MQIDIAIIIAVVFTNITLVGIFIFLMFWFKIEAKTLRQEAKQDIKDLMQRMQIVNNSIIYVRDEMEDFHRKLIGLQEEL